MILQRGADIIGQIMGFYTCKPKSRKWTITVVSYVIDMAHVNSSTTFTLQKKYNPCKQDFFEYYYTLLYQLIKPFIQSRCLNGLTTLVRQKIQLVLRKRQWKVEVEAVWPLMSEDKGRCHVCISNFAGIEDKLKKTDAFKLCVEYARNTRVKIILLQHMKYVENIRKSKS